MLMMNIQSTKSLWSKKNLIFGRQKNVHVGQIKICFDFFPLQRSLDKKNKKSFLFFVFVWTFKKFSFLFQNCLWLSKHRISIISSLHGKKTHLFFFRIYLDYDSVDQQWQSWAQFVTFRRRRNFFNPLSFCSAERKTTTTTEKQKFIRFGNTASFQTIYSLHYPDEISQTLAAAATASSD